MNLSDFKNLDAETLELIERLLPHSLKPIERLIGLEKTLALVHEFGGAVFVFPKLENGPAAARFAEIAEVIGVNETLLVSNYFRDESFYVPRCAQLQRVWRDRAITRDFDELLKVMGAGRAANELAWRYRLTARHIEMTVNGKRGGQQPYKRPLSKARMSYDTSSLKGVW